MSTRQRAPLWFVKHPAEPSVTLYAFCWRYRTILTLLNVTPTRQVAGMSSPTRETFVDVKQNGSARFRSTGVYSPMRQRDYDQQRKDCLHMHDQDPGIYGVWVYTRTAACEPLFLLNPSLGNPWPLHVTCHLDGSIALTHRDGCFWFLPDPLQEAAR